MTLDKSATSVLRALGIGRGRLLEVFKWAVENPDGGYMLCRAAAGFAAHRACVLGNRKRGWRLKHRINRWKSAEDQLRSLAVTFEALSKAATS